MNQIVNDEINFPYSSEMKIYKFTAIGYNTVHVSENNVVPLRDRSFNTERGKIEEKLKF